MKAKTQNPAQVKNEQLVLVKNDRAITTSLIIAEAFGIRHDNVLRDIDDLPCSQEFRLLNFEESYYRNRQNKKQPMVQLTKDGAVMLIMGYTGKRAMQFKEAYIKSFNEMQEVITKRLYGQVSTLTAIKGKVRPLTFNGRTLYPYRAVQQILGFSTKASLSNVRRKYDGLLAVIDGKSYVEEQYVEVMISRATTRKKEGDAAHASVNMPLFPEWKGGAQ